MALRLPAIILLAIIANCALASDSNIHSMVVGERVLQSADTRQLTFKADGEFTRCAVSPDGSYVACLKTTDESFAISIMRSKVGYVRSFIPSIDPPTKPNDTAMVPGRLFQCGSLVWSPDSKLLAIACWYRKPMPVPESGSGKDARPEKETRLLILQPDGKLKASCRIQRGDWNGAAWCESMMFSPDSRRIIISASELNTGPWKEGEKDHNWLAAMDVSDGRTSIIYTNDAVFAPRILSWTKDGRGVLCDDEGSLLSINVSDGVATTVYEYDSDVSGWTNFSCDGKYVVHRPIGEDDSGIFVKSIATGKDTQIAKSQDAHFERWFPNGDLLLYAIPQTIRDDSGKRTRELRTLWLSSVAGGNQSMCVALDAEPDSASSSYDYTKVAYILDHRVHLAELEWRNATPQEKLDAGLKLTEEEEKQELIKQARQIGTAFEQAMMFGKSELPGSLDDLRSYAQDKTFQRPGTNQMIFNFIAPEDPWKTDAKGKRYIPGNTIIGEFDAGYAWKVVVYISGDAQVLSK